MINILKVSNKETQLSCKIQNIKPISYLIAVSNALDILTTFIALNLGAYETNPYFNQFGWSWFLTMKITLTFGFIFFNEFSQSFLESQIAKLFISFVFLAIGLDIMRVVIGNINVIFILIR